MVHGFSLAGYHVVNIAIHIANTILVYLFVLLTFRTPFFKSVSGEDCVSFSRFTIDDSRSLIAFFSSLLFAVHPLQTEAVTYVFQRFVSLSAFFYLLSLVFYIKARLTLTTERTEKTFDIKKPKKFFWRAQSSSLYFLWLVLSFFSAILAMKTKETSFTLPLLITFYEFLFFRDTLKKRMLYITPVLLTMSIIPLTLMHLKGTAGGGTFSLSNLYVSGALSRGEYMLTQFRVIVTYLRLLFMPVNQNLDYAYTTFKSFLDPQVLLSFIFLSMLFGLGVYLVIKTKDNTKENDSGQAGMTKKVNGLAAFCCHSGLSGIGSRFTVHDSRPLRLVGFGILWFFITLSVESSIIPLQRLIDEYRVYLPSVGVSIAVVTSVFLIKERVKSLKAGKIIPGLLVLAAVALSITTCLRNEVWCDRIKLWEDTARKSPGHAIVHYNLGIGYQAHSMLDKAMEQFLITIKLDPCYVDAQINLGNVYQARNMFEKAVEQYLIAIRLKPDYAIAHNNLGNAYQARNMFDKAVEQYLIAIRLKPDYVEAHNNLGIAYYRTGHLENARREFIAGLKINPDDQQAKSLLREVSR
jgi:Tfp pilus assembly protein PilF